MNHQTIIKVCGVTDPMNAVEVCDLGVDMIGLNFWPPSSRFLAPEKRRAMAAALPDSVERIGVFVNPTSEEVERAVLETGLHRIQVHKVGWNRPIYSTPIPVIPAFSLSNSDAVDKAIVTQHTLFNDIFLIDAYHPSLPGGTGRTIHLEKAAQFTKMGNCIVAGGLTPENVAEVVNCLQPYGVDTASGVESAPGIKDPDRVHQFILQVRAGQLAGKKGTEAEEKTTR